MTTIAMMITAAGRPIPRPMIRLLSSAGSEE